MNIHSKHWLWLFIVVWGLMQPAQEALAQRGKKNRKKQQNNSQVQNGPYAANSSAQAEYYLIEGMKFFMLEKYDQALNNFIKASAFSSQNSSIDYKIAETYVKKGNFAKAEVYAQKALEKEKNNKYIYLLLADIYEKQEKYRKAADIYEALITSGDGQARYYYELADMYLRLKDLEKALQSYDRLEASYGLNERVIRKKQEIYLVLNEFEKAVAEGEKLIAASPDNPNYVLALAELLLEKGQTSRTLELLESNQQFDDSNPQLLLLMSRIYQSQGNQDKAVKALQKAFSNPDLNVNLKTDLVIRYVKESETSALDNNFLELVAMIVNTHPKSTKAHIIYADMLLIKDQKDKALYHYVVATQLNENIQTKVWQQILSLEAQKYALDSLIKHSEKALELYPNQALFWLYNGSGHLGKKNFEEAVVAAEEGRRLAYNNPQLRDDLYVILGDAYNGLEQYDESVEAYEFVLKNSPNHAQALNNYSYFLAERQENLNRAKELAARLVENYPDNPSFLDTYGWVLFKAKEYKKAEKYLRKAAEESNSGAIIEHYGDLLYKLGETNEALNQWIRAKDLGGTSPQIDTKIAQKKLVE